MGGFSVRTQPFSVYQAIDWICNVNASLENQIHGVRRVREMVERNHNDDVVQLEIPSRLVELLEVTRNHLLQSEIVWTLANLAAGTSRHTGIVLYKGLPIFLNLLDDDFCPHEIKSDVVWALSNIAGDCAKFRDEVLASGVMEQVLKLLNTPMTYELEKNCVWLLSNLCRHKNPFPDFNNVVKCIPYLTRYLHHDVPEIIANACWAFKYLADGPTYQVDALINAGICDRLVEIIETGSTSNIVGALLVCINISSGNSEQTQALLDCADCEIISILSKLLGTSQHDTILKNIAFLISNIAADSKENVQSLIKENVFQKLVKVFTKCDATTQIEIQKEILHAINNACHNSDSEKILHLESCGCSEVLCLGLNMDSEAAKMSLEAIWNMTLVQTSESHAATSITKFDSSIKKLQEHDDKQISSLAKLLASLL